MNETASRFSGYASTGHDKGAKLQYQKFFRHFSALLPAISGGAFGPPGPDAIMGAEAMLDRVIAEARNATIDRLGRAEPALTMFVAGAALPVFLDGGVAADDAMGIDTKTLLSATVDMAIRQTANLGVEEFPGGLFPYTERASMVATISSAHMTMIAIFPDDPMRIRAMIDTVCDKAVIAAKDLLGEGAASRDVYNLMQSIIREAAACVSLEFKRKGRYFDLNAAWKSLDNFFDAVGYVAPLAAVLADAAAGVSQNQHTGIPTTEY